MSGTKYLTITGPERTRLLGKLKMTEHRGSPKFKRVTPEFAATCNPLFCSVWDGRSDVGRPHEDTFKTEAEMLAFAREKYDDVHTKDGPRAGVAKLSAIRERFMLRQSQVCKKDSIKRYDLWFDRMKAWGIDDLKSPTLVREVVSLMNAMGTDEIKVQDGRRNKKLSPSGKNSVRELLRCIGNWCCEKKNGIGLDENPFDVEIQTEPDYKPDIYDVPEMQALLRDCLTEEIGILVALLIYTGMRLNECRWLSWDAFRWRAEFIRVTMPTDADIAYASGLGIGLDDDRMKSVKTSVERDVPLEQELIGLMQPFSQGKTGYVFSDDFIKKVHSQFHRLLATYSEERGVRVHTHPLHNLRHDYACMLSGAGITREEVQDRLGHFKPETTATYLKSHRVVAKDVRGWNYEIRLLRGIGSVSTGPIASTMIAHADHVVLDPLMPDVTACDRIVYDKKLQKYR